MGSDRDCSRQHTGSYFGPEVRLWEVHRLSGSVTRNALVLTGLPTFRVVGNPWLEIISGLRVSRRLPPIWRRVRIRLTLELIPSFRLEP
jgi:hypothetical protein